MSTGAPSAPTSMYPSTNTAQQPAVQQYPTYQLSDMGQRRENASNFYASNPRSKSCCAEFWGAPFRLLSWASIISNIFVHLPFMMFTVLWVGILFGFSVGFFCFFPIGPLLMMFSIASWRWLGKFELFLHKYAARNSREFSRTGLFYCGDVCVGSTQRNICSWDGFWSTLKDQMLSVDSWRPVLYFLFIKPFVAFFFGGMTFLFFVGAMGLIFNFVVIASCTGCDYGNWDSSGAWVLTTYKGSSITIPLGLLLLWITCNIAPKMAETAAWIALTFLGKTVPPGGDETTPIAVSNQVINFRASASAPAPAQQPNIV